MHNANGWQSKEKEITVREKLAWNKWYSQNDTVLPWNCMYRSFVGGLLCAVLRRSILLTWVLAVLAATKAATKTTTTTNLRVWILCTLYTLCNLVLYISHHFATLKVLGRKLSGIYGSIYHINSSTYCQQHFSLTVVCWMNLISIWNR